MLTLYIIALPVLAAVMLVGGGNWFQMRESRKLKRVLKNGREYEAIILEAWPINPSVFYTENIRLKVQILSETPVVVEFDFDASFPESQRELVVGKVITVDIDPADPRNVLIVRKSSRPSALSPSKGNSLLAI
ncbi:hypothetical protein GCM10010967_36360 [Dyadobacter beijingensis]|uniref:DUF3592 domain-containing protein n=1 Tax=Dyadobacter beijingensis TaxID=365489 RepID=A0ABQ2I352_9BACT|nr:hypothetical protein [Dyadobacter beijingensis]GGM99127.1 hypothetical protein GCM10010967_36360 [Dyadobacter beijingensis]